MEMARWIVVTGRWWEIFRILARLSPDFCEIPTLRIGA